MKYRVICTAWYYFVHCLSSLPYYTSHIVTGRAEKQYRSKQTQCLENQLCGFTDCTSALYQAFLLQGSWTLGYLKSFCGRALLESAPLTQLWTHLLLEQRQPSSWYSHSLTTPEPLHWQRQHNLILNTVFSLHLTAVHFPSSEVIWISLLKATSLCFVTVLTWNSWQAGTLPHRPLTHPAGSFPSCCSICFCSPLPQDQQLPHRKGAKCT